MSLFTPEELYGPAGHLRSRALFKEVCRPVDDPIMQLKPSLRPTLPVLRDYYIQYCVTDPSESLFVDAVFGDVLFWNPIKECQWFQPYYEEYKEAANLKRKSIAFQALMQEVQEGKNPTTAAKYLIEEGWNGRSTKAREKARKSANQAYEQTIADDLSRLKEQGLIN